MEVNKKYENLIVRISIYIFRNCESLKARGWSWYSAVVSTTACHSIAQQFVPDSQFKSFNGT